MSLVVVEAPAIVHSRKRTSSFSHSPTNSKVARVTVSMALRRTESYISLRRPIRTPLKRPVPIPATKPRQTSPLSPTRSPLPSRPLFPRSKPEPDLYRKALKACMKGSPEGQKILRMGPHLAVSMMSATMELERLVASAASEEMDQSSSAEGGDWEMGDTPA